MNTYGKHSYYSVEARGIVYMIDLIRNEFLLSESFSVATFTKRKHQVHKLTAKVSEIFILKKQQVKIVLYRVSKKFRPILYLITIVSFK